MTSKKDSTPVDFCEGSISQARSQDFSWGEGGGVRTSITGTKYFNIGMIHYACPIQVSDDTQGRVTNLGTN